MTPRILVVGLAAVLAACAGSPDRRTLAELDSVAPDMRDVAVGDSLDKALEGYRQFLEQTPVSAKTPEAMRRLADLQIERRYGIIGGAADVDATGGSGAALAEGQLTQQPNRAAEFSASHRPPPELPRPEAILPAGTGAAGPRVADPAIADHSESQADFEARAGGPQSASDAWQPATDETAPRQAIATYQRILEEYPHYERNDQVLYQMARAYDELGEPDQAMQVMNRLIREYARSDYLDEVYFRRAEYYFVRRKYLVAEESYSAVIALGTHSEFYELALYKLGWSLYKQELYEEALHQYMALLDYKVNGGYDFDRGSLRDANALEADSDADVAEPAATVAGRSPDQEDERRVADTFRVISLAFSNLGGPEVLSEYFDENGGRSYEDRIYSNLGEFYFTKLRYQDAATVYRSFTDKHPFHRRSPLFSMRVVEIYGEGGFAQLVVEAKQDYATRYALGAEYWMHFEVADAPEVLGYLKTNLRDLANHYHSLYQDESLTEQQLENYAQAQHWYGEYLSSFPTDPETPGLHYQLADLLFEHEDFQAAALAYEETAYRYAAHDRSSEAGYAAVFAHRQYLDVVEQGARAEARLATVESSLRFSDTFADHEHAATVLGAAADDLYDMQDYQRAIAAGRLLIDRYPGAEQSLRRSAWVVVGHGSMDLQAFADAEHAYGQVLELTPEEDETRPALYDNLAAAIYKQGEAARAAEDHALAAEHFLRVASAAPTSELRPAAEYDAAAALMKLADWNGAAEVFRGFRDAHGGHELQQDVTKQLAFVYRQAGDLALSAAEYERVADDADDPELRRESLLMAGDLYDDADRDAQALDVFSRYVTEYPHPVDLALEIRWRMAGMHEVAGAVEAYHAELRRIVDIDGAAGGERTARTRYLAGKSALVLAELEFRHFDNLALTLPFEASLAEKNARMNAALATFEALVGYQVPEVTTAATYYMAEIYSRFGTSLLQSERPTDLSAAELVEYDMVLEGEAFPFEERAIEVHEKNMELMVAGTFDDWVRRSLRRLATLMPGRYAKAEISSGLLGPSEVYAYRTPASEAQAAEAARASVSATDSRNADTAADDATEVAEDRIDVSAVL